MKKKLILQSKYLIIFAIVLLLMALDYFIYKKVLTKQTATAISHHYTTIDNTSYHRKHVTLFDDITVILNAQSSVKIPKDSTMQKIIILDGDAFFIIPPDQPDSVFVYTRMLKIGTTGTQFRLRAHDKSAGQTMEILKGNSMVSKSYPSSFADPEHPSAGEMIMINKDIDLMEKEKWDTIQLKSWLADSLVLQENIPQTIKTLEDWYDIDFNVSGAPPAGTVFQQKFSHAGLKTVLDTLSKKAGFTYRLDGNTVRIKF